MSNAPHENTSGHGGDAYRLGANNNAHYTVSREVVTVTGTVPNGTAPAAIAPNLAALFIVQNTHSNGVAASAPYVS